MADDQQTTTTKIVVTDGEIPVETLYPDKEVSLDEQRRHFCLMLAAEQGIPADKIVDLAAVFDEYLREGAKVQRTVKVVK